MANLFKLNFKKDDNHIQEELDLKQKLELKNLDKLIFPENPETVYEFKSHLFEEDFEEKEHLGTGKFIVKSFIHKASKRKLAIKFIHVPHGRYNPNDDNSRKFIELVREIDSFRKLSQNPNVVNCFGVCLYEGQALICMEQMDMSLKEVYLSIHTLNKPLPEAYTKTLTQSNVTKTLTQDDVENTSFKMEVDEPPGTSKRPAYTVPLVVFPEELLAYIAVAMLDALAACKAENVIHRDIKPENVLINKNGEIKMCDFGEARILHDSLASTFAGTLCYWPPERFATDKAKFDVRADIWSLGFTLVEIVRGSIPYRDNKGNVPNNIILLQNLILTLNVKDLVEKTFPVERFSEEAREFVQLCLNPIEKRPKYDGLKMTKFYQQYGPTENVERNKIVSKWLKFYDLN